MVFPVVVYGCESWTVKKAERRRIDDFELWCWRRPLRVPWTARRSTSPFWRRSALGFLWREWCWSWNSSTLATSWEELTHWKRLWCWEGLGAGGEGDNRKWDGWMASPTRWMWVWVNSRCWWWTGRPGVLQFIGLQRVGHDWVSELNWNYGGGNEDNGDLLQKIPSIYWNSPCPQPCSRPPPTHFFTGDSQTPTGKSPGWSLFLSPVSWFTKLCCSLQ